MPYFGAGRKVESLRRFDVEQCRNAMAKGTPPDVAKAREQRMADLQVQNPRARLRALKPGPRITNKCLTLLVGIVGYAVEHGFMSRDVAEGMDSLPAAEGEGGVIDQNVLTPAELRKVIDAAVDPWAMPVMPRRSRGLARRRSWACNGVTLTRTARLRRSAASGAPARSTSPRRRRGRRYSFQGP